MADILVKKKNSSIKDATEVKEKTTSLELVKTAITYAIVSILLSVLLFFPLWLSIQTNKLRADITNVNLKTATVERNIALLQNRLNTVSHMILATASDVLVFKEKGVPYYVVGK